MIKLFCAIFFRSGHGAEGYSNVLLDGDPADELSELAVVLGLYVDQPRLRFYEYAKIGLTMLLVLGAVLAYEVPRERGLAVVLEAADQSPRGLLDNAETDRLWEQAQQWAIDHGLPVAFVSYQRTITGKPQIALWYPKLTPPDGVLELLKMQIRTVMG